MQAAADDLTRYFARIGVAGPRAPSLAALKAIVAGHAAQIPFENIDVLLGRPVRLDLPSLLEKLVERRRGGYCFEHNTLLLGVLQALGFDAVGLAARVLWGRDDDSPGPRTHMLLRVMLPEGPYLADVGFGGVTLTAPLALAPGREQATPHEPHRLVEAEGELELQARLGETWTRLYHFSLQPQFPIDYEVANWFTSTHPQSLFTNNLLAARPDPDRRYALFNRDFTIHHLNGRNERRTLDGAEAFGEVLARYFALALPAADIAATHAAIARRAQSVC